MRKTYYWYAVTVQIDTVDENSGKIKKIKENYLVKAVSVTDAETQVHQQKKGYIFDWRILNISESKFIEIIFPENIDIND